MKAKTPSSSLEPAQENVRSLLDDIVGCGEEKLLFSLAASQHPIVTRYYDFLQGAWSCSIPEAMKTIGYRQHITLEEGMAATYKRYVEQVWL